MQFSEPIGEHRKGHPDQHESRVEPEQQQRSGRCDEHEPDTRGTGDHTSTLLGPKRVFGPGSDGIACTPGGPG
ncbi:hypothetical protein GCM10025869_31600 [Homoserinibacter gongjuensis]|uniref:Uncharacterized protein n=1 Tax=Homoserinibacter gongjuensis TaxID=1162968 RepID=A0ABQ6K1H9_9MICO|nr:hypothetical protein GCM10025869_31600 [Homoserinibacter gongjuensis]